MKKRGFGQGWWNGFGGKIHDGETIGQAALRELSEEAMVKADEKDLHYVGHIFFYFDGNPDWDTDMHVYVLKKWSGEPQETDEMKPRWFTFDAIPYDHMWVSDTKWLPLVLAGGRVEGEFTFNHDGTAVIRHDVRELPPNV